VIATPLTARLGLSCPVIQAAMGYVAGTRLPAAVSAAGGLGLIASATMSLDELRAAIRGVQSRTGNPFGVNLRADAPDAAERVALIIAAGVPAASFAQAPRPELIARLRDAGGTRRRSRRGASTPSSRPAARAAGTPARCRPACSSPRSPTRSTSR
jgi:NAD(P)H-dependent flavin oxidoreductase YrpB (nitropropane dioxygenase family)